MAPLVPLPRRLQVRKHGAWEPGGDRGTGPVHAGCQKESNPEDDREPKLFIMPSGRRAYGFRERICGIPVGRRTWDPVGSCDFAGQ